MNDFFQIVKENAAIIIAGLALILTVFLGWQNHRHNKLSVRPLLKFDVSAGSNGNSVAYKLKIANCGTGPAIIKDVKLFFDDKPVPLDEHQAFILFISKITRDFERKEFRAILLEDVLEAGKKITVFDFNCQRKKFDVMFKIALYIEYESFYGEKFPPLQYSVAADKK